jgi:hypothetical protein
MQAVPHRDPEAGFHRIHYDFHGSGVNPIDSCRLLRSKKKYHCPAVPRRGPEAGSHHDKMIFADLFRQSA